MDKWINLNALWKILVVGMLCGAGLPAVFAVGLRALSLPGPRATAADDDRVIGGSPGGMAVAALCFAVVLAAIAWGIYMVVNG